MPRHHKVKHFRCTSCSQVFLQNGKRQHKYQTNHVVYEEVSIPVSGSRAVNEEESTPRVDTGSTNHPHGGENFLSNMKRNKYKEMIQNLLHELQAQELGQSHDTRWHHNVELLQGMFPASQDIKFARIGTMPHLNDDADVWYVTGSEMEGLIDEEVSLQKPIVIRPSQQLKSNGTLDQFLEVLGDNLKSDTVDVQDFSTTDKDPVQLPVDLVIKRIKNGDALSNGRLPMNLLSLKFLGQASPAPAFLNRPRFGLIPAISSHLEVEYARKKPAGKRVRAAATKAREVDLVESMTFSLFAQRGSFTGFHVDSPDGTWVSSLWGLKAWIFPSRADRANMTSFEAKGDDWKPESIALIVLEPGDVLIMPPAEIVPHAVLTLEDSHMVGGMFMDTRRVLGSIEKLLWIATHPAVTNENFPLQLISGWKHLRDIFIDKNPSGADCATFDKLSQDLRQALSCSCLGPCRTKCVSCRCASSASQDGRCTSWCHQTR